MTSRPSAASPSDSRSEAEGQYSLSAILGIWAIATAPMWLLTQWAAPALIPVSPMEAGLTYWLLVILGMVWLFVLSTILLRRERTDWSWPELRDRLWLRAPSDPRDERPRPVLLLWTVPGILFAALASDVLGDFIDRPFAAVLPGAYQPAYADIRKLISPEYAGDWRLMWLALISSLFNYVLGEALLFHCVLLPKMRAVFGQWAWLANAVLFGLYHLHLLWMLPSIILSNIAYSWPAQRYRSAWLAILIHGFEAIVLVGIVAWVIFGGPSA